MQALKCAKNLAAIAKHIRCFSYSLLPARLACVSRPPRTEAILLCRNSSTSTSFLQTRRNHSVETTSNLIENISANDKLVKVQWKDGSEAEFHNIWLRDHCLCEKCLNPLTNQREVDILKLQRDIAPRNVKVAENHLHLTWPDGHTTVYDSSWLANHSYSAKTKKKSEELFLWDKERIMSTHLPNFIYDSVISNNKDLFRLSHAIIKYGFAFVDDTPTEVMAVEQLANSLGNFVRETHYGRLWEFSNKEMSHADTAYTSGFLHAHTDSTYYSCPAGLQMLHCINHDGVGGESLLVDGFHAADQLRKENFEAYQFLSSKVLPFRYIDDERYLKAHGCTIELDPFTKELLLIRYNHYDREIIDCLDADDVPKYYEAVQAFAAILRRPESEYWFKLVPGKIMIMGNWRVMHGRASFTGQRDMQGCYVEKDYFFGQYRSMFENYKNEIV